MWNLESAWQTGLGDQATQTRKFKRLHGWLPKNQLEHFQIQLFKRKKSSRTDSQFFLNSQLSQWNYPNTKKICNYCKKLITQLKYVITHHQFAKAQNPTKAPSDLHDWIPLAMRPVMWPGRRCCWSVAWWMVRLSYLKTCWLMLIVFLLNHRLWMVVSLMMVFLDLFRRNYWLLILELWLWFLILFLLSLLLNSCWRCCGDGVGRNTEEGVEAIIVRARNDSSYIVFELNEVLSYLAVVMIFYTIWICNMYFNVSQQMTPSPKWFPYSMARGAVLNLRHHIYAIGTCECERSLEKSLIWASKAMEPKKPW